jgi:kumamolisin
VAQVERALNTRIVSHGALYANISDPQLPAQLGPSVSAILGMNNFAATASAKADAQGAAPLDQIGNKSHFSPQDFWLFYNEDSPLAAGGDGGTASPDCIALLEVATEPIVSQPAPATSVLKIFNDRFGLPATNIDIISTDSAKAPAQPSDNEPVLDVDWAHAVAPDTPIKLYVSSIPGTTTAAFDTLALAVSQNRCGVISSSIDDENSSCPDLAQVAAYAQTDAQAVVQGQTLFHSSGDFGSNYPCGQPGTTPGESGVQPSIEESSASPDVTVVGGTQFTPAYDANGNDTSVLGPGVEQVWQDAPQIVLPPTPPFPTPSKGTSGGGISVVFAAPSWQQSIVPYGLTQPLTMRGVPDVSAAASPDSPGYWIASTSVQAKSGCPDNATTCFIGDGGTSASAPIWAAISRLIAGSQNVTRLGNINPQLYQLAGTPALVDVSVVGNNCTFGICDAYPGYEVGPGFDLGTGLGSPNIASLIAAFPLPSPAAGAKAAAFDVTTKGGVGETVGGGSLVLSNVSALPEGVRELTMNLSDPGMFSALSLTASINGGAARRATTGAIRSSMTFAFNPSLIVPVGGSVTFLLKATLTAPTLGLASGGGTIASAGAGRSGKVPLGLVFGLALFAMVGPSPKRLRLCLVAVALMAIAASEPGCGGDGESSIAPSHSQQSVPALGIAVTNAGGTVNVEGLPATLGLIDLIP